MFRIYIISYVTAIDPDAYRYLMMHENVTDDVYAWHIGHGIGIAEYVVILAGTDCHIRKSLNYILTLVAAFSVDNHFLKSDMHALDR